MAVVDKNKRIISFRVCPYVGRFASSLLDTARKVVTSAEEGESVHSAYTRGLIFGAVVAGARVCIGWGGERRAHLHVCGDLFRTTQRGGVRA